MSTLINKSIVSAFVLVCAVVEVLLAISGHRESPVPPREVESGESHTPPPSLVSQTAAKNADTTNAVGFPTKQLVRQHSAARALPQQPPTGVDKTFGSATRLMYKWSRAHGFQLQTALPLDPSRLTPAEREGIVRVLEPYITEARKLRNQQTDLLTAKIPDLIRAGKYQEVRQHGKITPDVERGLVAVQKRLKGMGITVVKFGYVKELGTYAYRYFTQRPGEDEAFDMMTAHVKAIEQKAVEAYVKELLLYKSRR